MANQTPQGFPTSNTPFLDETGQVSLPWLLFFATLYNKVVSPESASAFFNYPTSFGQPGQLLTSEGPASPTTWSNRVNKLSELTNDMGFVSALTQQGYITDQLSLTIPHPDAVIGSPGSATSLARGDHVHPFPAAITTTEMTVNGATWTAGQGVPKGFQPNGSLYSNLSGGTGSRLYVSTGTAWNAVPGV